MAFSRSNNSNKTNKWKIRALLLSLGLAIDGILYEDLCLRPHKIEFMTEWQTDVFALNFN